MSNLTKSIDELKKYAKKHNLTIDEVINNKIYSIKIVDDIMFSQPEVREELFKRVIENQNLDVDIISEATITTKAYLKSIEVALKK